MKKPNRKDRRKDPVNKEMISQTNIFVQLMFASLGMEDEHPPTWAELSRKTGLSATCIRNLYYGTTTFPEFMTIQKLGRIAGFVFNPATNKVSSLKKKSA